MNTHTGILLINLGTPSASDAASVKRYLDEFLTDPKVIDIPNPWRTLLVRGLITPFRAKKSAHAYQQIWTKDGSPLLVNSLALKESLKLDCPVSLGMNYGEPSIKSALEELKDCDKLIVVPLFPQYSSAVTESILEKVKSLTSKPLEIIKDFYNDEHYIQAMTNKIQETLTQKQPEYLLFSYHGLPMRQLYKTSGDICKSCINNPCPAIQEKNRDCYRAQCYETSRLITEKLALDETKTLTCFQSRLGRLTWTGPYTEKILQDLAFLGIKNIAITCPSFVTDCLETLEEIGIRAKQTWLDYGGEELTLIPALNEDGSWLQAIVSR
ncbi:MAG: ferrochelatase [Legionellales bacterium]|jgi:ferrochelatase